jgi:chloramphenicol 3-O phosphotransferase
MAWAGHHVITESVILPRWVDTYLDAFDGLTVVLVGVRCPLGVAQERERRRTDRRGGPIDLAVPDFDALHRDVSYDVDFDTSVTAVADAVRLIRDQLRSPATAFDVLRARRATST